MLNRLLIEILKEVGEGTAQPYQLTRVSDELMRFTTKDGDDYEIEMDLLPPAIMLLAFKADSGYDAYAKLTNRGDIYRIMATVIAAVKQQLIEFPTTDKIIISPSKTDEGDNRRLNLYLAYIKKNALADWTVGIEENRYTMEDDIVLKRNK